MVNRRGLSLLELLIAVIIFTFVSISLGHLLHYAFLNTTLADQRAKMQNEMSLVLEHMHKSATGSETRGGAIGLAGDWAVKRYAASGTLISGIRIRVDNDTANPTDPPNGAIDANDRWVAYVHRDNGASQHVIEYYDNAQDLGTPQGTAEVLANHILIDNAGAGEFGIQFLGNFDGSGLLTDNVFEVIITTRWDPAQAQSPANPQMVMKNRIYLPGVSISQ